MATDMMTADSVFDKSAKKWVIDFDGASKKGYTTIKVVLPDGWADGNLFLVCFPYMMQQWVKPIDSLTLTVKTEDLGSRGYVYVANLKDGNQKNTPFYTYRIREGEVIAIGR